MSSDFLLSDNVSNVILIICCILASSTYLGIAASYFFQWLHLILMCIMPFFKGAQDSLHVFAQFDYCIRSVKLGSGADGALLVLLKELQLAEREFELECPWFQSSSLDLIPHLLLISVY